MQKNKNNILTLLAFLCISSVSFGMVWDNRYIPLIPHQRLLIKGLPSVFAVDAFFVTASRAASTQEEGIGIPEIFGDFDQGTLSDAFDIGGIFNSLRSDWRGFKIPWGVNGKLQGQGAQFFYHQAITQHFSLGFSWFFMRVNSSLDFTLKNDSKDNDKIPFGPSDKQELDSELRAMFRTIGIVHSHSDQAGFGDTKIGVNCVVDSFSIIENSIIADNATIEPQSIVRDSHIGHHAQVGPFAHIRHNSSVKDHGAIGNFVEVKNSTIGAYTKAKHLSYLGDALVGSHVNIGAGTITCNYDGIQKNTTVIEDGVHIGSNNSLIAPLTIEKNAFTAAGSVITENVPEDALAIARARQINKEGYAKRLRAKKDIHNFSFMSAKKTKHMDDTPTSENI